MKVNIHKWISRIPELPVIRQFIHWSKHYTLPGFQGVSIYATLTFIIKELKNNDINIRASAMAYDFFLALFPSMIFLFTLSAYLPKSWDFVTVMETSLNSVLPDQAQDYLWKNIVGSLKPKASGNFLSIGFVLAIFFASNGILTMMRGFDKVYHSSFRKRGFLERQSVALVLTILFGILLMLSVVVVIMGNKILLWLFSFLHLTFMQNVSGTILKYLILIFLFYLTIDLIYRLGPAFRKPMKSYSPGTIFATATSLLTSILFGYFIDNFSSYHKVYGTISALIITLIWIRLNVLILLLGFELNAGIIVNRDMMNEMEYHGTNETTHLKEAETIPVGNE
ncbi:MAG: YihY/virulence factor BrkB family protein [Saprospiraceae bacterium]|nr:YihY/virulence factor BrkB family protein [Saprospiraceae bacterium]HMW38858.1 YihY/virulence factor BrkB family protein [Saprospiraceae bacterium]HMX87851.1 YihY/virulence factor BrkB family protein [Saprospiraceae bacterium]HMZ39699.1 YihY/virulence factor BrkB family protein [Saprospiraceae bacterium]HNA64235.1 YihY/virulence factor BrkB family protein [Saprospiraceae bacterium]